MHLTVPPVRSHPTPASIGSAAMSRSASLNTAAMLNGVRARIVARWLRRAVSRLERTAPAPAHPLPGEEERRYASTLIAAYGKLD